MFSVFCKYLLNDASYGKRHPFTKYSPLKYASIGTISETIGATVESVEQFEINSFFETRNKFLSFVQISPKRRILPQRHSNTKYSPLMYASIGTIQETIGATVESVEQFEVKSFFETRNNFLSFLQISPKRRILPKKAPLHEIFAIKVRIDWYYSGNDGYYG